MQNTPAQIMAASAALLNDQSRRIYTNTVQLAYLNLAMNKLQEIFELNNIAVVEKTSGSIAVAAGVDAVGYTGTVPQLPSDLIEIEQLWESPPGLNQWTPMTKNLFLPHYLENGTRISQFLIWAWLGQEIKLIPASSDNDLKIDYVRSLFLPVTIDSINDVIAIRNVESYLQYQTAALCAMFIGENPTRAEILEQEATSALERSLQISIKGTQQIAIRRRPYRASWKSKTIW